MVAETVWGQTPKHIIGMTDNYATDLAKALHGMGD